MLLLCKQHLTLTGEGVGLLNKRDEVCACTEKFLTDKLVSSVDISLGNTCGSAVGIHLVKEELEG